MGPRGPIYIALATWPGLSARRTRPSLARHVDQREGRPSARCLGGRVGAQPARSAPPRRWRVWRWPASPVRDPFGAASTSRSASPSGWLHAGCVARDEACRTVPAGLFVARRDVARAAARGQSSSLRWQAVGARLSPWSWMALRSPDRSSTGAVPFVATVAGSRRARGRHRRPDRADRSSLVLEQPGAVVRAMVDGCRLPTGPGRPWVLHLGSAGDLRRLRRDRPQRPRHPVRRGGPRRDLVAGAQDRPRAAAVDRRPRARSATSGSRCPTG